MVPVVRCLYGIPTNELVTEMIQWLAEDETRKLIILDEALKKPLNGFLEDPRVRFISLETHREECLAELAKECVFSHIEYFPQPANPNKSLECMQAIFSLLQAIHNETQLHAFDFQDMGINILKNVYRNAPSFPKSVRGTELFHDFSDIPAIICGAGPSLEKSAETLQRLEEHALLFAGGSALSALGRYCVVPHFSASIDPGVSLKRFLKHSCFEVPFFYQSRLSYPLLNAVQGTLVWMPPSGNYPLELWLQEEIGQRPEIFDGGWNVVTFLTAIAYELGCNPIIFVGCDFSYTGKAPYASGVGVSSIEDVMIAQDEEENWVYSRRDWAIAANWLGQFIQQRPDVNWVNASDVGLAIAGSQRQSLDQLKWARPRDLRGLVHTHMQSLFPINHEINAALKKFKESFQAIDEICTQLIEAMEDTNRKNPTYLFLQIQLQQEPAYQQFFLPIWNVWKYAFVQQNSARATHFDAENLHQWLFIKRMCHDAREI